MSTDRIAEFEGQLDARAFAKMLGPEYLVCYGLYMPWAVRPATAEEMAILGRSEPIPGTVGRSDEPTDYQPAPRTDYDSEDYDRE